MTCRRRRRPRRSCGVPARPAPGTSSGWVVDLEGRGALEVTVLRRDWLQAADKLAREGFDPMQAGPTLLFVALWVALRRTDVYRGTYAAFIRAALDVGLIDPTLVDEAEL